MPGHTLGLRERKRLATERALQEVAVRIAVDEGIDAVTVDRVCDEVMVSRSTFFNYFASREQAIFGKPLDFAENDRAHVLLERYGHDLPLAVFVLISDAVRGGDQPEELTVQRLQIFVQQPEVTSRVSWGSGASRAALGMLLEEWLDKHPERAALPVEQRQREVRMAIGIGIIVGEEVMHRWQGGDGELPTNIENFNKARADLRLVLG
ncbi:TetR/AcrR family transcriptional regulator [Microbacterium gorillae]|uniref:TetR/AcrR family transcriptional regulator n=1 Tax=Microbacterium gorillae TaxID=1231063 RepID=UPI000693AD87|nr:helix-turn-helix domain-containing protein [Microbacterium gorillae]